MLPLQIPALAEHRRAQSLVFVNETTPIRNPDGATRLRNGGGSGRHRISSFSQCSGSAILAIMDDSQVRRIIHVDMDAFYASVEQRDDPILRGRPVAVGYAAKRGVVAAASYEARRFGVRSAMPSTTALRQCPELVFVPPRFEVYRAVSEQVRRIFADYTPLVEPLSLDEAYLDVTENLRGIPTASATAEDIRARILAETGLTASAGISYNKFLAKLASDYRKPNGQFVITPEMGPDFVEELPVGKFHGIGPVTADKMKALGIQTGRELRERSLAFLQQHFGKAGAWYFAIARAEDDRPVIPDRPRKSSGSETTFAEDLTDQATSRPASGDGGRCLGLVREAAGFWPHRDRQDQIRRFPARDAQPIAGRAHRQPGPAQRGRDDPDPLHLPARKRRPADRRDAIEFSIARAAGGSRAAFHNEVRLGAEWFSALGR